MHAMCNDAPWIGGSDLQHHMHAHARRPWQGFAVPHALPCVPVRHTLPPRKPHREGCHWNEQGCQMDVVPANTCRGGVGGLAPRAGQPPSAAVLLCGLPRRPHQGYPTHLFCCKPSRPGARSSDGTTLAACVCD